MARKYIQTFWLSLILCLALLIVGVSSTPTQAHGTWPPFIFAVTPEYEAGQITYNLFFLSLLEGGDLVDLDIRVPLPATVEAQDTPVPTPTATPTALVSTPTPVAPTPTPRL